MEKKQTNLMVLVAAAILAILGAVLIFVPGIELYQLSYVVCGGIVIGGVYSIVKYFLANSFREESDYGFSIGVFMGVLGITGFIKTNEIVKFFPVAMSLLVVLFGVIVLQDALDLKRLNSNLWIGDLGIAIAVLVVAMVVLINPFSEDGVRQNVSNYLILITGVLLVISKAYLRVMIKGYDKRQQEVVVETPKISESQDDVTEPGDNEENE